MKSSAKGLRKFLKRAGIFLLALLLLLLAVRAAGRLITGRTPKGGINDSFFTDINGQEMWFSVYSEDPSLPVLLYLHGGPGMSTSFGDWVILRKLAKDYTVVNWDQRNCGKTWIHDPQDTPLTPELLRSDLLSAVQYILDYTGREKLTLLGNSWETMYGCDFALSHPELVDCVINTSMSVDICESDRALKSLFLEWSENDPEYHALAEQFDPNGNLSEENKELRLIESGCHLSTMLESETLAAFVHEAAQRQKTTGSRNPSPQNE